MKINRLASFGFALLLSLVSLFVISAPKALAATKTWTGAGGNCNFSTAGNWSPSGAPSTGDDLVFDNTVNACSGDPTNNISGLTVNSISWINSGSGGAKHVEATTPITVTSSVYQQSSVTGGDVNFLDNGFILGGNVIVRGVQLGDSSAPSTSTSVNLNGNTLTFNDGPNTSTIISVAVPISGTGTVVFDAPNTDFQTYVANTYSGVTNIVSNSGLLTVGVPFISIFGSSSINVNSGASLFVNLASSDNNTTLNNTITFAGETADTVTTNWDALFFSCTTSCSGITVNVPNIILNGNIRLGSAGTVTVNLTGSTANGHCVEYYDDNGTHSGTVPPTFIGGPPACVLAATINVSAPNTGAGIIRNNPIVVLGVAVLCAGGIALAGRKYAHLNSKK